MTLEETTFDYEHAGQRTRALLDEIGKAVIGQTAVVEQVLVCLLSAGHVLIEGVAGLGKTLWRSVVTYSVHPGSDAQ
jgi:MoxR-like ATPase